MDTLARIDIIKQEIADLGFPITVRWHNSDWGKAEVAYDGSVRITIPHPINDLRTGIAFHEIGHVALGHMTVQRAMDPDERSIRGTYRIEQEACKFAEQMMDKYGFDRSTIDPFQKRYLDSIKSNLELSDMINELMDLINFDPSGSMR